MTMPFWHVVAELAGDLRHAGRRPRIFVDGELLGQLPSTNGTATGLFAFSWSWICV